ncbi:hypothetical protein PVAP13_3NG010960, partial [Panicum virgatum]
TLQTQTFFFLSQNHRTPLHSSWRFSYPARWPRPAAGLPGRAALPSVRCLPRRAQPRGGPFLSSHSPQSASAGVRRLRCSFAVSSLRSPSSAAPTREMQAGESVNQLPCRSVAARPADPLSAIAGSGCHRRNRALRPPREGSVRYRAPWPSLAGTTCRQE